MKDILTNQHNYLSHKNRSNYMRINKIILITLFSIFSSFSFASSEEITSQVDIPEGLKDCKFYKSIVSRKISDINLYVVRCQGNDNVSASVNGKYPIRTTLIEGNQINEKEVITLNGKKYIKKDELIKNTKTINLNGFEYIELK